MPTATTSTTFEVSSVTPNTEQLAKVDYHQAVREFLGSPIEACSRYHGQLLQSPNMHPLVAAVHCSFCHHYPLVLSPDIVWLTIVQGFAVHVNENPEELRHKFVSHEGKDEITVRRDDFVKGSPENPWPELFSEFSAQIKPLISDAYDLVVGDFSTTGPVEKAAYEVALLDTMQSYFNYSFITLCGIPTITLEGTSDDWQAVASRAESLRHYDLNWWIDPLGEVLQQFVEASQGKVDRSFWDSIYKFHGPKGSGTPFISGWLRKLFPYIRRHKKAMHNDYLERDDERSGPDPIDIPRGPSRAPFVWNYLTDEYAMELFGGLIGVAQDPDTLALRPEIGWAVREAPTQAEE
ncbi:DUF4419 domain-containing protein [Aeoliella sp.]|uniref:DUF4419 domain-containing protein n=1 Tax=Aeoliella sp. TaxID=2795800 RepID=UPI003CCBC2C1